MDVIGACKDAGIVVKRYAMMRIGRDESTGIPFLRPVSCYDSLNEAVRYMDERAALVVIEQRVVAARLAPYASISVESDEPVPLAPA